jgi:hypothetical protein
MSADSELIPIKSVGDIIKAVVDVVRPNVEAEKPPATRAGPLVVVGRLYLSLTIILALVTSIGAIVDWKMAELATRAAKMSGTAITIPLHASDSVEGMRCFLVGVVVVGLLLGIALLVWLAHEHPFLLSSPTEFSEGLQQEIAGPIGKDQRAARGNTRKPPAIAK